MHLVVAAANEGRLAVCSHGAHDGQVGRDLPQLAPRAGIKTIYAVARGAEDHGAVDHGWCADNLLVGLKVPAFMARGLVVSCHAACHVAHEHAVLPAHGRGVDASSALHAPFLAHFVGILGVAAEVGIFVCMSLRVIILLLQRDAAPRTRLLADVFLCHGERVGGNIPQTVAHLAVAVLEVGA